jgi:hypothetical protein
MGSSILSQTRPCFALRAEFFHTMLVIRWPMIRICVGQAFQQLESLTPKGPLFFVFSFFRVFVILFRAPGKHFSLSSTARPWEKWIAWRLQVLHTATAMPRGVQL